MYHEYILNFECLYNGSKSYAAPFAKLISAIKKCYRISCFQLNLIRSKTKALAKLKVRRPFQIVVRKRCTGCLNLVPATSFWCSNTLGARRQNSRPDLSDLSNTKSLIFRFISPVCNLSGKTVPIRNSVAEKEISVTTITILSNKLSIISS